MKLHLVSIITPSYKSEEFIVQAIESVRQQTYSEWEMIIVDDLSPDSSNELIQYYVNIDRRIRLIKLKENKGPAVARNVGIKQARGRYIAFLDADDVWYTDKLEKQLKFMSEKNCALSCTAYNTMKENGEKLNKIIIPPRELTYDMMIKNNFIGCLTAMYDTEIVGKVYMPDIRKRQDYGLWLKILRESGSAYGLSDVLACYRIVNNSVSRSKIKLLKYNYQLFRHHEKLSVIKSVRCLLINILYKLIK